MGIKIRIAFGLVLLHLLTCYFQCRKDCAETSFGFAITNKIYPDKDSILVGDTVWVEIDVPVKLWEEQSNTERDYSGAANLSTAINFLKLGKGSSSNTGTSNAANLFKYRLVTGDSVTPVLPAVSRVFRLKESNGRYRLKVGVVPQEKGDFMISPGDAAGVYRHNNKCDKASFQITIADTDQHLYLYQQSRPGYEISSYERTHVYCVRVK